jgi:hypothetical protein
LHGAAVTRRRGGTAGTSAACEDEQRTSKRDHSRAPGADQRSIIARKSASLTGFAR